MRVDLWFSVMERRKGLCHGNSTGCFLYNASTYALFFPTNHPPWWLPYLALFILLPPNLSFVQLYHNACYTMIRFSRVYFLIRFCVSVLLMISHTTTRFLDEEEEEQQQQYINDEHYHWNRIGGWNSLGCSARWVSLFQVKDPQGSPLEKTKNVQRASMPY